MSVSGKVARHSCLVHRDRHSTLRQAERQAVWNRRTLIMIRHTDRQKLTRADTKYLGRQTHKLPGTAFAHNT